MANRGARAAKKETRRNGPMENATVDIAGNVDNEIDVDSDSSSDNELLEEVARAPHGTYGSDCPIGNGSGIMVEHG